MPACSALLLVTPLPASATPKVPTPKLVSDALAAPFNIAFKGYSPYVADGGLNQVVRVRRDGTLKPMSIRRARHVGAGILQARPIPGLHHHRERRARQRAASRADYCQRPKHQEASQGPGLRGHPGLRAGE